MRKLYIKPKLVYGVGRNDADYPIFPKVGNGRKICPFYKVWNRMLERCYSKRAQKKNPTYVGCRVCDEWLLFSNFKKWMEQQDWEGKEIDKDILLPGNRTYSPETCVFVKQELNKFLTDHGSARGEFLIGVVFSKKSRKFAASCNNPFERYPNGKPKQMHLGHFDKELEAHLAWKNCKHKIACIYADQQSDPRVAETLRKRYL